MKLISKCEFLGMIDLKRLSFEFEHVSCQMSCKSREILHSNFVHVH